MSRRFSVSTDPLTPTQEKAFIEWVKAYGWWHWLPNHWLIVDRSNSLSPAIIRDKLLAITDTKRAIILEVNSTQWAALVKADSEGRPMEKWIQETWEKD